LTQVDLIFKPFIEFITKAGCRASANSELPKDYLQCILFKVNLATAFHSVYQTTFASSSA